MKPRRGILEQDEVLAKDTGSPATWRMARVIELQIERYQSRESPRGDSSNQ